MKTQLINALVLAISSLENKSVHYDWQRPCSCNCGVIAQAITGETPDVLAKEYINPVANLLANSDRKRFTKKDGGLFHPSWSDMAKQYCSMTGAPTTLIFKQLHGAGLTKDDILHLEFLSDKKICERAGIEMKPIVTEKKIGGQPSRKARYGFLKMFTKTIPATEPSIKKTSKDYFTSEENLVKYLKAWVEILKEDALAKNTSATKFITIDGIKYAYENKADLEKLKEMCIKNESFEKAGEIRELIEIETK